MERQRIDTSHQWRHVGDQCPKDMLYTWDWCPCPQEPHLWRFPFQADGTHRAEGPHPPRRSPVSQWARATGPPNLMRTLWAVPSLLRARHAPLASGWQSVH